jgi:hemoglobin-like flavoprotein
MIVRAEDARLLAETLPLVRDRLEVASAASYANLFAVAPEMRALFRDSDLHGQGMRFMSTLVLVAELAGEPERLEPVLGGLARAHALVGVRPEHFAPMGSALMVTLGEALGRAFTAEVQAAWRAAYDAVAAEMIARMPARADHGR